MVKFDELNQTEKDFVVNTDFFGIDEQNNIIDANGRIVEDHMDILREMEHYRGKDE